MPETLVIRLPDSADAAAECLVVDGTGAPLGDIVSGALNTLAELAGGRRVIGLAPASSVLRTRAEIPLKAKAKIQQALPFALEEQLAGDVDDQHFAFAGRDTGGRIPVAVVARESIDNWIGQLSEAGLSADALYAESDALAAVPSTLTLLVDGDRVVIREADGSATVADPDSLQTIVELLLDAHAGETTAPTGPDDDDAEAAVIEDDEDDNETPIADEVVGDPINLLVYCRESDHERFAVLWDMLRLRVDSMDIRILPDGALPRLASQIVNEGGVNLLQGVYAPRRELPLEWQLWKLPGILLAAFVAIMLIRGGVDLWQLGAEEQALDAAAAELLQNTFPGVTASDDPWSALRSRLGASDSPVDTGGPGFAEAAEALADAYSQTAGLNIEALSYRDGNVDLQLVAPSVDRLEQLRKGIAEAGFAAEIQSANPDGDTIKGRVRISTTGGDTP